VVEHQEAKRAAHRALSSFHAGNTLSARSAALSVIRRAPRTKAAALAAERDKLLGVAVRAAHAQKAVLEAAAFQVRLEFVLHVSRQRSVTCFAHGNELGVVPLDELIEEHLFGPVASVARRLGERWRARARSLAMASGSLQI
jgi:hypothetical protein